MLSHEFWVQRGGLVEPPEAGLWFTVQSLPESSHPSTPYRSRPCHYHGSSLAEAKLALPFDPELPQDMPLLLKKAEEYQQSYAEAVAAWRKRLDEYEQARAIERQRRIDEFEQRRKAIEEQLP